LDNLVWASNVGMINPIISGDLNWKTSKNFFSIIRTLIKLATSIIDFKIFYVNSKLKNENTEDKEVLDETFKNRSKLRIITVDILHLLLKIIVSLNSLKLEPFYSFLHPITVSLCGIIACIISLFKIYYKTSETEKKLLKNFKDSQGIPYFSSQDLKGLAQHSSLSNCCLKSTFELCLLERAPNSRLFEECYFKNYYIDFNKDFPTDPNKVLNANTNHFFGKY
jgi:hypothetical protein